MNAKQVASDSSAVNNVEKAAKKTGTTRQKKLF